MSLSVVFFGTPTPALPVLEALLESEHQVKAVVTAPDRPRGRGMDVGPSPVKERAIAAGREVLQPPMLRDPAAQETLAEIGADLFVVVAYGLILPKGVLEIPPGGGVNVHFSLLPRLRGAAPIQWALIEGFTLTGVTIIQMDEGMDTGPILAQLEEPVTEDDDAGTLEERLAARGAALLVATLKAIERGTAEPTPQHHDMATYAPKLTTGDARIRWADAAEAIAGRVRAFSPRPGAWTTMRGRRLKVWRVAIAPTASMGRPGSVDLVSPETLLVDTGSNKLALEEVQPEGGRRMSAAAFLRGHPVSTGEVLD
ncbi:MAG: methionyl-tRNA formyltransferase [Actinomycetota bacterium]